MDAEQTDETARLRSLLADLEWAGGRGWDGENFCPICANQQVSGHEADCRLAQELRP